MNNKKIRLTLLPVAALTFLPVAGFLGVGTSIVASASTVMPNPIVTATPPPTPPATEPPVEPTKPPTPPATEPPVEPTKPPAPAIEEPVVSDTGTDNDPGAGVEQPVKPPNSNHRLVRTGSEITGFLVGGLVLIAGGAVFLFFRIRKGWYGTKRNTSALGIAVASTNNTSDDGKSTIAVHHTAITHQKEESK